MPRPSTRVRSLVMVAIAGLLATSLAVAPAPSASVLAGAPTFYTKYVAASGSASTGGDCTTPDFGPDDYSDGAEGAIEAAIAAAQSDGTVVLCNGTHSLTDGSVAIPPAVGVISFRGESTANTIVDGGGATRLFDGSAGPADVTFIGLTLQGGDAGSGDGGAVLAADVTIVGVRAVGNFADGKGGAVYAAGTVDSRWSLFRDNTSGNDRGGAVYAPGTVTSFHDTFEGNSSYRWGGAVYSNAVASLVFASFIGNEAEYGGAAVYAEHGIDSSGGTYEDNASTDDFGGALYGYDGAVRSLDDVFRRNFAEYGGGAIYSEDGTVESTSGTYEDNTAGSGDSGGAIFTMNGPVASDHDRFRRNSGFSGGAIWADGDVSSSYGIYEDNTAFTGSGGAIYSNTGSLTTDHDAFRRNYAAEYGGAIYLAATAGTVTSTHGVYEDNATGVDGYGGAIDSDAGAITLRFDQFRRNRSYYGGAVYSTSRLDSSGGTYEDNAGGEGGAIYVADAGTTARSVDDTFRRNSAESAGGALALYGIDITGGTFEDNTARTGVGGAIWAYDTTTIDRSTFARNSAYNNGGAVAQEKEPAPLYVTNSTFVGNQVADNDGYGNGGGALYAYGDLHATYSTFVDNSSSTGVGQAMFGWYDFYVDHVLIAATTGDSADCYVDESTFDAGFSIETGSTCLTSVDSSSGVPRADLRLGTFAKNSGTTWTYSLQSGSLAIDFDPNLESCASVVATDQRGVSRTTGDGCDTGAFEFAGGAVPLYNGPWWVNSSTALQNLAVAATIDPATAGCTVRFDLSGATWTTSGSTGDTTSFTTSGVSRSDGSVSASLANVPLGIYDVVVTITGGCSGSGSDTSVLGVLPGTVAKGTVGGGWYKLADSGGWKKSSFSDIVSVSSSYNKRTGVTTTTTKGQLVWYSAADNSTASGGSGWRLKATISRSTTDGTSLWQPIACPAGVGTTGSEARCGRYTGTGLLEQRRKSGRWESAPYGSAGRVTFTVTVYDGGRLTSCVRKTCKITELADWFGITIVGVPTPTSPSDKLPQVGAPVRLKSGSLRNS